jgi:hypothetical protein
MFVLRAEITISALNNKLYNISQQNFAILLISLCSFYLRCLIPFSLLRLKFSLKCKLSIVFLDYTSMALDKLSGKYQCGLFPISLLSVFNLPLLLLKM